MVFECHNHPHLFDELFAFMYIDALVGGSAKNLASIEVVPDIVRVRLLGEQWDLRKGTSTYKLRQSGRINLDFLTSGID